MGIITHPCKCMLGLLVRNFTGKDLGINLCENMGNELEWTEENNSLSWQSVLDVEWMNCLVMFCWMMLACIIGMIVYAATPQVKELALCIAAFEPVEALIHQF
jgi:hypothetical protein